MSDSTLRRFALWCDADGRVLQVIFNNLCQKIALGSSFLQLIDPGGLEKGLNFLREVRERDVVFDRELNISLGRKVAALHSTGAAIDGKLLILAAENRTQMLRLYEEMIAINSEQSDLERTVLGICDVAIPPSDGTVTLHTDRDDALYDEISHLNNNLVNLQRELIKKNQELERLNTQKDQFLGMASHDLRAPLSAIQAYSEFLLDDSSRPLSQEQIEFVSIIRSSSEFMLGLVNDLLDIAAIESGKLQLHRQATDLVTLLKNNINLNKVLASAKGINLELAYDDHIPAVTLDPQRIDQVLNNLISNAFKFSLPGSTVRVRVTYADGAIQVSVADEGQGIPAEELGRLFQPFSTTTVKSTAGEKSTGLGLLIARKVMEGHGGRIWVESIVGKGSVFSFSLPAASTVATTSPSPPSSAVMPKLQPGLRILLAEDSVVHQQIVLRILAQKGYAATVAASGVAVLENLQRQPYDVILMDVHMPEMDGIETTRQIRQRWPAQQQPFIIAMTASTQLDDRRQCLAAGMDDYIAKPTPRTSDELFQALYRFSVAQAAPA